MSLLELAALYGLVFLVCLVVVLAACVAGRRDDEAAVRALRERRDEREARSDLGYWKGGHHS